MINLEDENVPPWVRKSQLADMQMRAATINKKRAKEMADRFPALVTNLALRKMFFHLLRGRVMRDKKLGYILLPCWLLAQFAGVPQRKFRTEDLLILFQEIFPDFTWRDYWHEGQECRMVVTTGIPEMFDDMLTDPGSDRVYIDSFKKQNYRNRLSLFMETKEIAKKQNWKYKDAEKIAHYHLAHKLASFIAMLEEHFPEALEAAKRMENADYHLRVLQEIWDLPVPVYFPTMKGKTPRLFARGLPFLQKVLRKILCKDWIEIDIRSCYAAIVTMLAGLEDFAAFLLSGESIWKLLLEYAGITEQHREQAKAFFKIALYSIVFGKQIYMVQVELSRVLDEAGIGYKKKMIHHPLIKELAEGISHLKEQIEGDGGAKGAYGWMKLEPDEDIDSFLACWIQTFELKLITPIYDLAIKQKESRHEEFDIMLHQHDGVSIKPRPGVDREKLLLKLRELIEEIARELGILTTLVWEE